MSTTETETTPRLVLSGLTMNAIQMEATRAHLRHGENSMMGERYSSGDRLAILMEEVGEVAHELTYDQDGDRDKLVRELIQVAAMAASWVEFLEGGGSQEPVVLPAWAELTDLDKGAALLHLSKRENEGTSYAMENYPARFSDHPQLVALGDEDASRFAVSMEAAAGTLSDAEYERLSNLAADADEKRWATEAGGAA